ncbi:hypothetical protein ACH5RR_021283 [Cinchona calisaya]|uniref:Uncharacterized protein n=1 Tax=Cinchona calisaya TaxID=153742 RepID=A0ABD2ZHU6_9GENT
MLGDFVDSLGKLWELLNSRGANIMVVSVKIIYEGLRFLRTILKNQQVNFNELDEQMMDLLGVVVSDAGIVICSLFVRKTDNGVDLAALDFLEKIKLIMTQFSKIYPTTSTISFPSTNELDFIDLFL